MRIASTKTTPMSDELRNELAKLKPTRTANTDPSPFARTLDEFVRPMGSDPAELLKHRYLCKGGGLLLVGPTGV